MTRRHLISLAAVALAVLASASASTAGPADRLATARAATAGYHQIGAALDAGYGLFPDAAGIACIAEPGIGAMGIHYANGTLFANPAIDAATPEVLVYEPKRNGKLRLIALEYVVVKAAWDATHSSPPSLFGQTFNFSGAGNRYGLPPFYSLHAWIWKHNPAGMFAPFNPNVSCAAA